jgi:hypothetical protein
MPAPTKKSQGAPGNARDPLANLLYQWFSPLTFGIFIFLADVVVDAWLGWRYQVFFTSGPTPGLLQDPSALLTDFVVNPLLAGTYLWTSRWSMGLLARPSLASALEDQQRITTLEALQRALYRNRWIFALVSAVAVLGAILQVGSYMGWFPWRTIEGYLYLHNGAMSIYRAPFWFLTLYAVLYTAFNTIVFVYIVFRLFDGQYLKLQLLHPDGCGGLSDFSEYAVTGAALVVPAGVLVSTVVITATAQQTLMTAYPVWVMLIAYVILAPTLLLLPLYAAHRAMVRTREAALLSIATVYDREYQRVTEELSKKTSASNRAAPAAAAQRSTMEASQQEALEHLEQIKRHYERTAGDFPTWPLNTSVVRRFAAVVLSPIVPALISIAIDLLRQRLLP